jgi:hypothetical protein
VFTTNCNELAGQSAALVFTTEQTQCIHAPNVLMRRPSATSTPRKSSPSTQSQGGYSFVSCGSDNSVQSGKIPFPCGGVVECGLRCPAFSTDTDSTCLCLPPLAQRTSDNSARLAPFPPARIPICLLPRNLHHLLGLRPKIRVQLQNQATGRFLGHP